MDIADYNRDAGKVIHETITALNKVKAEPDDFATIAHYPNSFKREYAGDHHYPNEDVDGATRIKQEKNGRHWNG